MAKTTLIFALLLIAAGCTHSRPRSEQAGMVPPDVLNGPQVLAARPSEDRIELNRDLQPTRPMEILAEVREDGGVEITDVRLRFDGAPLEIAMQRIPLGTTWRATMTGRQFQLLSVAGRTVRVSAHVTAIDSQGRHSANDPQLDFLLTTPIVPYEGPETAGHG